MSGKIGFHSKFFAFANWIVTGSDRAYDTFFPAFKDNNMANIVQLPTGKFALTDRQGFQIGSASYSRARDARRGAARLGVVVA